MHLLLWHHDVEIFIANKFGREEFLQQRMEERTLDIILEDKNKTKKS